MQNNREEGRECRSELQQLAVVKDLTVNSGIFIWKLTNVSQLLATKKDKSVHSPCFFTHEGGYKLQLELDVDGYGVGKGTHMSLFFKICKGPHDDDLTWPCNQGIILEALDLTGGGQHASTTYEPGVIGADSWQKPLHRNNKALGQLKLISHTVLCDKNCRFLVDDTLYIRVSLLH